jgi:hypothetical protein
MKETPMSTLYRTMIGLFVAAAALLGISGISALKNADHGWKWILGGIGWFGGLLLALVVIILALYTLARAAAARRRANTTLRANTRSQPERRIG